MLTASATGIADPDGLTTPTFHYQWLAADVVITRATGLSYTLVAADAGKTIKVWLSFIDDANNAEKLTSAATAVVAAKLNSPATGAPTITGTAQVGETLEAVTDGIADLNGLTTPGYSYQWISRVGSTDSDIVGANGGNYTPVDDDVGKAIRVRVSFTDDANNAETLTSAATAVVAAKSNSPARPGRPPSQARYGWVRS